MACFTLLRFFWIFIFVMTDSAVNLCLPTVGNVRECYRPQLGAFTLEYRCVRHFLFCLRNARCNNTKKGNQQNNDESLSFLSHGTPRRSFSHVISKKMFKSRGLFLKLSNAMRKTTFCLAVFPFSCSLRISCYRIVGCFIKKIYQPFAKLKHPVDINRLFPNTERIGKHPYVLLEKT